MSYIKFHSCKINDSDLFKEDSLKLLKTKKKGLMMVVGKLKETNKTEIQEFRYDKTIWDSKRAKKDSVQYKGKFEAARMRKNLSSDNCVEYPISKIIQLAELTADVVSNLNLKELYDSHKKVHNLTKQRMLVEFVDTHALIANEFIKRKMLHHSWDELDAMYTNVNNVV